MTKGINLVLGAVVATGALIGFSLSFTALSPLVIGGIIGFSSLVACIATSFILESLGIIRKEDKEDSKLKITIALITTTAVGVAFGAAVNPAIMLSMWTAALAGAAMGVLGIQSFFFADICIIDPIVEKVAQCFSKETHI